MYRTPQMNFATATIGRDEQQVKDLLSSAFYGGIGYWSVVEGFTKDGKPAKPKDLPAFAIVPGAGIKLALPERANNNPDEWEFKGTKDGDVQCVLLTPEKLQKGVQVMAEKYPQHFADWCKENSDATTGDVFVQCALFGEIVFG